MCVCIYIYIYKYIYVYVYLELSEPASPTPAHGVSGRASKQPRFLYECDGAFHWGSCRAGY